MESASQTAAMTAEAVMRLAASLGFSSTRSTAVSIWPRMVSGSSRPKVRTPATVSARMSGVAPKAVQICGVKSSKITVMMRPV